MTAFQQHADTVYNKLLQLEAEAGDDQLFLCSYLLGHISLVSASEGETALEFETQVRTSLDQAYEIDSLTDQDKSEIDTLWQQLLGQD